MSDTPSVLRAQVLKNIEELAESQGMTKAELAERTSYSPRNLHRILSGESLFKLDLLEVFADALDVPPVRLLKGTRGFGKKLSELADEGVLTSVELQAVESIRAESPESLSDIALGLARDLALKEAAEASGEALSPEIQQTVRLMRRKGPISAAVYLLNIVKQDLTPKDVEAADVPPLLPEDD